MPSLIPTQKPVADLVREFSEGNITIPEIQRDVVWKPDQVKQLIDSIFLHYPCGSLIFWEPREKDGGLVRSMIRPERLEQYQGRLPRYFLLDGQQRLTATREEVSMIGKAEGRDVSEVRPWSPRHERR